MSRFLFARASFIFSICGWHSAGRQNMSGDTTTPPKEVAGKKPRPPPSMLKKKAVAEDAGTKMGNKRVKKPVKPVKPSLPPNSVGGIKKPHRFRPGIVAEREIRREQKSKKSACQMAPFERLVREILGEASPQELRLGAQALKAIQVATEAFAVELFNGAQEINMLTEHDTLEVPELRRSAKELGIALPLESCDFSRAKIARADRARERRDRKSAAAKQSDK